MSIHSIPIIVIASSSFCVGIYHFLIYIQQRKNRKDLTFALLCLGTAIYDVLCIGLYNSSSVAEGVQWQRLQYILLSLINIIFLWFISDYTNQKPQKVVYVLSFLFLLFAIAQIIDRSTLTWQVDQPPIKEFILPFGITVTYHEASPGPITILQSPIALFTGIYILWLSMRFYRRGHKREGVPLLIALGFVYATIINDTAVSVGLYTFIYLLEYGFTATIFMMAYSIWNTIIEAAKTKETLVESEERFRSIVEYSHSGILTVNNNYQLTYVNDQLCNILGYSRDELIDKDFRSFLDSDSRERLEERIVHQNRGDTIPVRYEMSIIRKDGNNRLLEMSSATTVGSTGYVRMISQALDITERRKIELALAQKAIENVQLYEQAQRRAEQLATLNEINRVVSTLQALDTVLEIIYQQVQRIAKVDAFYISLYNPELDQISFPLMYDMGIRFQEPASHLEKASLIGKVIHSGNPLLENRTDEEMQVPIEFSFGDKTRKAASIIIIPLRLGERVTGAMSIQSYTMNAYTAEDVNIISGIGYQAAIAIENAQLFTAAQQELQERRRIEIQRETLINELEAKNAELERFTYTVSHDLKSPLVTIRGFLGYLEKDAASGDLNRLKADAERITTATEKMQRLLNELLELSRIGRMMNPPVEVRFSQLVQDAVELVHEQIIVRGVQINIEKNLPSVYGDRSRLLEVMQNLVDNAVKFMGNQAEPCIHIGQKGNDTDGKPIFFVQDNGIGIEPQFFERVFGLFNKLDTQSEGTGIGLALVKRIVEVHNGRVWVESEGAGKGTTFSFTLPQYESNR